MLNAASKGGSSFLSAGLFPKAAHIRAAKLGDQRQLPLTRPASLSDE